MTEANAVPPQVQALENSFKNIPGIEDADVGKHYYSEKDVKQLNEIQFAAEYADLPIAMLRRTSGNLDKELLINVAFKIERNEKGLKALEFLSWWVRDISRSGENAQIRSIGLPPIAGKKIQLGNTLRFWFEAYIVTEEEDISLVLNKMGELSESLNDGFSVYKSAFVE